MAKPRRNLTLDADVDELLGRVGNASDYLSRVIRERWREWTDALATLAARGWTRSEIYAACDALNGTWLVGPSRSPQAIALELHDAARFGALERHGANADTWGARVREVAESHEVTHALVAVVTEFWFSNAALESMLERLP